MCGRNAGHTERVSEENLERVRAILLPDGTDLVERFGGLAGGVSGGGLVADDATVKMTARSAEIEGVGAQGFREGWLDWLEPWQSYRIYQEGLIDRGDRVIALVRLRGVTKHDSVEMEHEAGAVFRFEGEKVVELEFVLEPHDVLQN